MEYQLAFYAPTNSYCDALITKSVELFKRQGLK